MNNSTQWHFLSNQRIKAMTALAGMLLALTGCEKSTQVTTSAGGHQICAVITGNHSINSQPGQGTISSPAGKIIIERARVRFDDAPWTAIPEAVPVEVRMSKGKLWLAAGPVTIKRTVR